MTDFPGVKCGINALPQKKRKLVFGKSQVETLFKRTKAATPVHAQQPSPLMKQLQQQQPLVHAMASDRLPIYVCLCDTWGSLSLSLSLIAYSLSPMLPTVLH